MMVRYEEKNTLAIAGLSGKKVAVVSADYFEALELTEPLPPNLVELGYGSKSSQS